MRWMATIFLVGLDSMTRDHEAQELPLWNLEETFLGVQLDLESSEVGKRFFYIGDEVVGFFVFTMMSLS
jgi:hypothetical protein